MPVAHSLDHRRVVGCSPRTRWWVAVGLASALTAAGVVAVGVTASAAEVATVATAPAATVSAAPASPAAIAVTQVVTAASAGSATIPSSSTNTISFKNTGGTSLNGPQVAVLLNRSVVDGGRMPVVWPNTANTLCLKLPAPPGYTDFFTCRYVESLSSERGAALARGATWTLKFAISGPRGSSFTSTVSAGSANELPGGGQISELSSPIGPGADVFQAALTAGAAPVAGSVLVQASVENAGPAVAVDQKIVLQVKAAASITGTLSSSSQRATCTSVTPAAGYAFALACTRPGSAAVGLAGRWDLAVTLRASARGAIQVDSTVSATSPIDPLPDNNAKTVTFTL